MKDKYTCPKCQSPDAKMEKIDGTKVRVDTSRDQTMVQFRCDKCGVTAISFRIYMLVED